MPSNNFFKTPLQVTIKEGKKILKGKKLKKKSKFKTMRDNLKMQIMRKMLKKKYLKISKNKFYQGLF